MGDEHACAEMGTITDAHKRFEPFVGTFAAEVKMWMGPGGPTVSTGTMENALDLGGLFLKQSYQGDATDGPFPNFAGRGFWGYNTVDKKYEGLWIDTVCSFMQTESGEVDASGKVWTMIGEMTNPGTGQPMRKRTVITLQDENRNHMETYFTGPDGKEFKAMEIQYVRKS
ncbi:MAG: hypothetical protein DHS20C16_31980 [Phycisphaerae bacterium]|nr:MAG: hypothetical protein DHS20C16_31980 [Phycisphaerae bacterium]